MPQHQKNFSNGSSKTSPIIFKFNENIKASLNWAKIAVKNLNTGKKVVITSKWIKNNSVYILTGPRSSSTWYQIYLPTAAVKDNAGNKVKVAYLYFKT